MADETEEISAKECHICGAELTGKEDYCPECGADFTNKNTYNY